MAVSELVETAEYDVSIEKFQFYTPGAIFFWKKLGIKPAASYGGKISRLGIIFHDEYDKLGYGYIVNELASPYLPYVEAYAPYESFKDFYHLLQTEKPCYFFVSSDDDYPTGSGRNVRLSHWYIKTSDEPLGEGPVDRSP